MTGWRRSSYCGSSNCVEVTYDGDLVLVRDSKDEDDPVGPTLRFTTAEWAAFVAGVAAGQFNARPMQ